LYNPSGGFCTPAVRVKDWREKPGARAGRGGKGKARTCNGKPDRRFYQRWERPGYRKAFAGHYFQLTANQFISKKHAFF